MKSTGATRFTALLLLFCVAPRAGAGEPKLDLAGEKVAAVQLERAGIITTVVSIALAGVGAALIGALTDACKGSDSRHCNANGFWAGVGLTAIGGVGTIVGLPVWLLGRADRKRLAAARLTLAPLASPRAGAAAVLTLSF